MATRSWLQEFHGDGMRVGERVASWKEGVVMSTVFQIREKSLKPEELSRMLVSHPRAHQGLTSILQIDAASWRPVNSFLNSLFHPGLVSLYPSSQTAPPPPCSRRPTPIPAHN